MFVLMAFIVFVSLVSITALVREVATDGYRRAPQRNLVRAF